MRKALTTLLIYIRDRTLKAERISTVLEFKSLCIMRETYLSWRKVARKQAKERRLQLTVFNCVRLAKLDRLLKVFREVIH